MLHNADVPGCRRKTDREVGWLPTSGGLSSPQFVDDKEKAKGLYPGFNRGQARCVDINVITSRLHQHISTDLTIWSSAGGERSFVTV